MVIAATSCGSVLGSVDLHACLSSLLPEIVSKDSKTRPYRCGWRASGEHSAQRELAFEHTDRRFHPATELLQRSEPLRTLMPAFFGSQTTHFRDAHPQAPFLKLPHVLGAVVTAIRGQLLRLSAEEFLLCRTRERSWVLSVGLPPWIS